MTFRGLCCSVFLQCDTFSFCIQPFHFMCQNNLVTSVNVWRDLTQYLLTYCTLNLNGFLSTLTCVRKMSLFLQLVCIDEQWVMAVVLVILFSLQAMYVCVLCLSVTSICTLFIGNQSPFLSLAFSTSLSWSPLSTHISLNIYFFITVLSNCLPKDLPHLDCWCCS